MDETTPAPPARVYAVKGSHLSPVLVNLLGLALERLGKWESDPEERQALVDDDIEPPTPAAIKKAKASIYRLRTRPSRGWPITFKGVGMGRDGEVSVYYSIGRFDIDERAFKTGTVEIFAFDNTTNKLVGVYDWHGFCKRSPVEMHVTIQGFDIPYYQCIGNIFDTIRFPTQEAP
jgi:hypothetical protein